MLTIEKIEQNILTKYSDTDENVCIVRGSFDDSVIENAEKELGVTFAEDYKSFFKKYQCFSFGSSYIALNVNVTQSTNVVKECDTFFPKGMYVLEDPYCDGEIFLQDSNGNVYEYIAGAQIPPNKIHSSLREFLNAEYRYFDKRMKRIMAEQNK